ncbi:hypothetical protein AX774_g7333 [Zancudomyces culisetae]|uniref:Uncharacterized protein n=1 Tax=Zancudomyces culisetae TaxID=1213189 RepID=A0A1R1PEB0_ZANCU|nr:hypothetical protein AX774_g7333 [Zancudomyces culisetae]|eukprot:OMH79259.1 hypothetical protein AX774_g7333 [Zancudomyces culisetae]
MAKKNSSLINSSIAHTPSSPLYARPHSTGRPTNTAFAPSASALNTSVPLRTPPSISTGIFPSTASTTSATASIVAVTVSSCRPPHSAGSWNTPCGGGLPCISFNADCTSSRSSSKPTVVNVEIPATIPCLAAALTVAASPSGCAIFCMAVGAINIGLVNVFPSKLTSVLISDTFLRTLGRIWYLPNARMLSLSVTSSCAPEE